MTPFAADKVTFEESAGQSVEPFLAGSVPDLHFQLHALHFEYLHFEVDRDCGQVVRKKLVFVEPLEDASLADSAVPDQQYLDHVVIGFIPNHIIRKSVVGNLKIFSKKDFVLARLQSHSIFI